MVDKVSRINGGMTDIDKKPHSAADGHCAAKILYAAIRVML
ncbi:hypothetical protein [uncultured Ruminococcus sp.]|nr:hypothetical protein [uncultured Ruminococcus sp.]